jgi:hypothetical protein
MSREHGPNPEEMGLDEKKSTPNSPATEKSYLPELGAHYGIGDIVKVRRSNGAVESDWIINSFGEKSVVLRKTGSDGEKVEKVVPRDQFVVLQQSGSRNAIKVGTNVDERLRELGLDEETIKKTM